MRSAFRMPSAVRGFTLVELLVVVAILTLLIALLVPALASAREQAKLTGCLANHRSIVQALSVYAQNNDDHYPFYSYRYTDPTKPFTDNQYTGEPTWGPDWQFGTVAYDWASPRFLGPYISNDRRWGGTYAYSPLLNNSKVLYCTSNTDNLISNSNAKAFTTNFGIGVNKYTSLSVEPGDGQVFYKSNYTFNYAVAPTATGPTFPGASTDTGYLYGTALPRKVSMLTQRVIVTADVYTTSTGAISADSFVQFYPNQYPTNSGYTGAVAYRHRNQAPAAFADGHAESYTTTNPANTQNTGLERAYQKGEVTPFGAKG